MPLNETIREIKEGQGRVIDRSFLFSVQTPQTFSAPLLKQAYQQEFRKEFTDDATLVEALGHKVHYFPGESRNIKITRQEDLALAELIFPIYPQTP
jgi:2-C-methyl-D-erythritol 4-phosphate cytidylyltransferase